MENAVRWSIRVAKETDTALRSYLARQGGKRGDLAKFVDEAVRWRVLDMTVRAIRERNKEIPEGEIQDEIDREIEATRGKRRAGHKH